jgi:hypothetical protein
VLSLQKKRMEPITTKESSDNGKLPLVVVAFKTTVTRKNNWQQEADYAGLPLSSYLDGKLTLFDENEENYLRTVSDLNERLKFYENSRLQDFLKRLQGKQFNFIDTDGNQIDVTVASVQDVFTLLIHSFKISGKL